MLEFIFYPFIIRAILVGGFLSILLGILGPFIITRKMSFMGDGIAHASLSGVAMALLLGWAPIPLTIFFSILIAVFIYFLERKTNISNDVAIAIIFTTGMSLGIVLLSFYQGYQPELMSYLFGNILTINNQDIFYISIIGFLILLFFVLFYRKILFSTIDPVGAYLSGIKVKNFDLLLYILTAVSIVVSIKLVGIVLVSALLVIPSVISRMFVKSFKNFVFLSSLFSFAIVVLGIILSFYLDLPTGATIVLFGVVFFLFSNLVIFLKKF